MKIENARKLGFFSALAMLVGTVVGIGIFFKNTSVQGAVKGDGLTWLLSWILGGILSLSAAISFSEIGSMENKKISGLPGWVEKTVGKKSAYFTRFNYAFFYYGLYVPIFGIFISESFFQIMAHDYAQPPIWVHIIIGFGITAITITTRFFSLKASGWIQNITTGLKIVPLIIAIIVGIALFNTHNLPNNNGGNAFSKNSFNFKGLIAALPAILFSYDCFLNASNLTSKTKGGSKTVSKVVLFGMISIVIIYSLVAISSILHSQGNIENIIKDSLPIKTAKYISIIVWAFITVSAYGVQNGMAAASINLFEEMIDTNTFFGSKKLINKWGKKKATIILALIIYIFWNLVFAIPALIMESDAIIDGITNWPTLFFFAIYGMVILSYSIKRNKIHSTQKISNKLFKIFSFISVIGIFFIIGFQLFITQTTEVWQNPNDELNWGFLKSNNLKILKVEGLITFEIFLFAFIVLPIINRKLIMKYDKIDPINYNSDKIN